ncbi:hypothetical protein ACFC08_35035 [Streptomyces sp. NPDC056112]|uniref:hypothetical protein n=1 Tax=Streptomyces sp. NPDC056112 TaxID=3345715 RepID=UPI0035E277B7
MDPELAALASTAATTMVGLLASDGWETAKGWVGRLWRRGPRPEQADVLEGELVATRDEVRAARESRDEDAEQQLAAAWNVQLRRLLAGSPDLADEVRLMVEEMRSAATAAGPGPQVGTVDMRARASGHGRVYQAGRDQHINER